MDYKAKIRVVLLTICLVVASVSFIRFIQYQYNLEIVEDANDLIAEETNIEPIETDNDEMENDEEEVEEELFGGPPVDFGEWQSRNPDIHGWIRIPGTPIDYPILQSDGNQEFYLNHNVDREPDGAGAIFTQNFNRLDFRDTHTLIYGHNMADGAKFGSLSQYLDFYFLVGNDIIYIHTPRSVFRYQIVYAITYDDRHILESFDFRDEDDYSDYLDTLRNAPGVWNPNVYLRTGDRIITLSTCNYNPRQRFLVGAVLIDERSHSL